MRFPVRSLLVAATTLACAAPAEKAEDSAAAATPPAAAAAPDAGTVIADLGRDVEQAEKKFIDLAKAIPAEKYAWRPAQGVRSVGEVLLHVGSDNWLLPAAVGFPADSVTGIKGDDYKTAQAFEQRKLGKDSVIAELERSFAHLKKSLSATQGAQLGENTTLFGQSFTKQQAWILATTHLHEHLGQLIAYARSNNVKPPWSN